MSLQLEPGVPRSREGMRLAAAYLAGTGESVWKLIGAADAISEYLAACPPEIRPDGTVAGYFESFDKKLEQIMSEDAAIQAVAADIQADVATIAAAVPTIQAALTAALADAVQPSTVTALQAAQSALDSLTATVSSDASSDAPPAAPAS
jgi:hypothetical protein